ncbi:alpha/beta fold hydrolase [Aeromicrobium sp. UC242_57]|uniref:alpha/beta fold hydrolase n=1 Tax=Aeromicrobium sp. UC242_57 TaxID=3374624 RepID=UPI0037A76424
MTTTYRSAPGKTVDVGGSTYSYRELGPEGGVPVIFLNHLAANLDNWDPRVVDGFAAQRHVIAIDYRGVGRSTSRARTAVDDMARDMIDVIRALGHQSVDLHGFSLGGMVSQAIVVLDPQLVRRLILTGTGPAGGTGIDRVTRISIIDILHGLVTFKDPKTYLFFTRTPRGKQAAAAFLDRLGERTDDRDAAVSLTTFRAQLKAIHGWGVRPPADLSTITIPVFIANGDADRMVPTVNSENLAARLPDSRLRIYPDAGHGGVFQFHDEFVREALEFLAR